jgi:hypothetical protein
VLLAAFLAVSASVFADTLVLKDGRKVTGTLQSADARQVTMLVQGKVQVFSILETTAIYFGDAGGGPAASPTSNGGAATAASGAELPPDTRMTVRTRQPIDSTTAKENQLFNALVVQSVIANGKEVVPAGAQVFLKLSNVDKSNGQVTGRTNIAVTVDSILIGTKKVPVIAEVISSASDTQSTSTANRAGSEATRGGLTSALKGGVTAARRGAQQNVQRNAASIARGPEVKIPSETQLSFIVQVIGK